MYMNQAQHQQIVSFIWGIANDVLRDDFTRGKYRDVILPMTVIRRLDCLLEPTKDDVLKMKEKLDASKIVNQEGPLRKAAGYPFYNISKFTLRRLLDNPKQLKANFKDYLNGFSDNVQDVIDKFKFRNQIDTLCDADLLGLLIEKFTDPSINLSPKPVMDSEGREIRPALHNHTMGTIFEELIRRFNEENNEEAGEHFTPRDVVDLMAKLILLPIADKVESGTYLLYDGACGTGGMLTVAEETLQAIARENGKEVAIHLHGQEVNPEIYAITKSDLLIKGEGEEADNIAFGSTLSADGSPSMEFDFMISNPPYGKDWKKDLNRLGESKDAIQDPRFIVEHNGDPEFRLIPAVDDGQMLFLANMLSKMKHNSPLGSRIAEVHNGSSLFTGDAGSGESNIRQWIIENDWLEAIVALPTNIFYNTGIATYIWVLTNRKSEERKGKVQLIDATKHFDKLRKNLGQKNCLLNAQQIKRICEIFIKSEENEQSKIFPNAAFGFYKVTTERPLRLSLTLSEETLKKFDAACAGVGEERLAAVIRGLVSEVGSEKQTDLNTFLDRVEKVCEEIGVRFTGKRKNLIVNELAERDETAAPIIRKKTKLKPETELSEHPELNGQYLVEENDKKYVIEYEADADLRDTEQVPMLEDGGIEGFFKKEVLPYAPDTWIDEDKTKIGYEIPFTRYFSQYEPLRDLSEITKELKSLEDEAEGLLDQITNLAPASV